MRLAQERDGDYFGPPLNRVARLLAAGHGGQVLLTQITFDLVRDVLPPHASLRDLDEHRLRDLSRHEHVYQLVLAGLPADFPPLRSLDHRPNNLPTQVTGFIGRERELTTARERLLRPDVRLLTLTGPGGTGKTRLALQLAADVLDDFPDGACFVPLASLSDPALVLATVTLALGVRDASGRSPTDTLRDELRDKRLLLVLDTCEQVLEAMPQMGVVLGSCPGLKLLVTSRAVLHLHGEREVPVPPLELPDALAR